MKDHILELDKPRTLRFGFKAMRMIRNKFGDRSLDQLLNLKIDEMPILAHAGLTHEDKALTIEQVEDLLDTVIPEKYTILGITNLILEALVDQMGIDVKKAKAGALAAAAAAVAEKSETVKPEEKKQPKKTTLSTKKQKK